MKRTMKRLSLLLALCLLAAVPATMAEDALLAAPVDAAVEKAEGADLWTEDIAKAVADDKTIRANPEGVPLTNVNFPDSVFYFWIEDHVDLDDNFLLSPNEISLTAVIFVEGMGIQSLKGIRYFTNLQELYCGRNQLTSLDLSGLAELEMVWCMDNQLTSLDVTGCGALYELTCYNNQLSQLRCGGCTSLAELSCRENQLASLDVADCAALRYLECNGNKLTQLDIGGNAALTEVYCYDNRLTQLNTAGCGALEVLNCADNQLTTLDVSGNAALTYLNCSGDPIASLDLTDCPALCDCVREGERLMSGCCADFTLAVGEDQSHVRVDAATRIMIDGAQVYPEPEPPSAPIPIADCEITGVKAQVYTGRAVEPEPVVTYDGQTLEKGADYEVTYRNNKAVGRATVVIKGIGNYTGMVKKAFKINPKKVALTKLTAGKGRLTVQWKKTAGAGYQIQYSTKKNFSGAKSVTITKTKTVRKVLKNLKSGKMYYVRIRGYKKVGGKAYVSKWSKALKKRVR